MKPVDVLIEITTGLTMNPKKEIIKDGFIGIEGSRIVDIGAQEEIND